MRETHLNRPTGGIHPDSSTRPQNAAITRRSALYGAAAAFCAPAAPAQAQSLAPVDTMALWLDRLKKIRSEEYARVTEAIALAEAIGISAFEAEAEVLAETEPVLAAHEAGLSSMRIGTPQTARRALAWATSNDMAGGDSGQMVFRAIDAYLAELEGLRPM